MSPWMLLTLQMLPLFIMAGVLFFFGRKARRAQNELIDAIKARYPQWVIEFRSDGSTTAHQVNSREEHEALTVRLRKS